MTLVRSPYGAGPSYRLQEGVISDGDEVVVQGVMSFEARGVP